MKKEFYVIKFLSIIGFIPIVLCGCTSANKNVSDETVQITTEEVTTSAETTTAETTEAETTTEEVTEAESKSIEDYIKDAAKIAGFTDEEVESIVEDARVYEAYGSSAEIAADMAIKDAVNGKSNGQEDYAVTLPQVVDENGNPYPTDENGQPIIPETTQASTEVAENTGMIDDNGIDPSVYADLPLTKDATASEEEGGYNLKIYGNDEFFIVTEKNGIIHYYNDTTKLKSCLAQLYFSSDEYKKQQQESGLITGDIELSHDGDFAMTGEELRKSMNDPNAVNGALK